MRTASSPSSVAVSSRTAVTMISSARADATPICTASRPVSMKLSERNDNAVQLPRPDSVARRSQLEFLPAALEIMETPASPVGRAIAATIILFLVMALGWSILGHIDIVATASGKVAPTGRTKTVQPLETGIVTAILVKD